MKQNSEEHQEAMFRAAQLFYEQELTQEEVGRRLHLTRWKVGRLLEEARATGIVQIQIVHPRSRRHAEERALVDRFALDDAVVVPHVDDEEELLSAVSRAAADHLTDRRPSPRTLGVSWGHTLTLVAAAISPGWARGVHVIQANGGLSRSRQRSTAADVALRMAQQGPGSATVLPAPAIVERSSTRTALESELAVGGVLDAARSADSILFSLGTVSEHSVLVESGYLSAADMARLERDGACGDMLGRFIDREGRAVDPGLEDRTVGLSLDDVRRIPRSIAVAAGAAKQEAVRAAVTTGLCSELVTDEQTAHYLLETVP